MHCELRCHLSSNIKFLYDCEYEEIVTFQALKFRIFLYLMSFMVANHDAGFYCDFCNFFCGSTQSLCFFKHLVNTHSNDPNFKVYYGYCPCSFTKVNSLQKHYYRDHKNVIQNNDENPNLEIQGTLNYNDSGNYSPDNDQQNIDSETAYTNLKHHAAKFLLCAKERGKITQTKQFYQNSFK